MKYSPKGMTRKIKNALSEYERTHASDETQRRVEVTPMEKNRGQLQVQVPARKLSPIKTPITPSSKTTRQAQDKASHIRKRGSQEDGGRGYREKEATYRKGMGTSC